MKNMFKLLERNLIGISIVTIVIGIGIFAFGVYVSEDNYNPRILEQNGYYLTATLLLESFA